jgi:hypothetical protein
MLSFNASVSEELEEKRSLLEYIQVVRPNGKLIREAVPIQLLLEAPQLSAYSCIGG